MESCSDFMFAWFILCEIFLSQILICFFFLSNRWTPWSLPLFPSWLGECHAAKEWQGCISRQPQPRSLPPCCGWLFELFTLTVLRFSDPRNRKKSVWLRQRRKRNCSHKVDWLSSFFFFFFFWFFVFSFPSSIYLMFGSGIWWCTWPGKQTNQQKKKKKIAKRLTWLGGPRG